MCSGCAGSFPSSVTRFHQRLLETTERRACDGVWRELKHGLVLPATLLLEKRGRTLIRSKAMLQIRQVSGLDLSTARTISGQPRVSMLIVSKLSSPAAVFISFCRPRAVATG